MKTKTYSVAVVLVLMGLVLEAKAQTPDALAEADLVPVGDLTLRQRCELVVRFMSDAVMFAETPEFGEVDIADAIVIPARSGRNFSKRRGGDTWIGVERSYAVFPRKAGTLTVPAITVKGHVRTGSTILSVQATTKPLSRHVIIPDGFLGYPDVVVTPQLEVAQRLEPDVNSFKVGEGLKRTITVSASDTAAMLLPVIEAAEPNGMAVYPEQPVLQDRDERGTILATRTDSMMYMMEQKGEYSLPEITVYWWDPQKKELNEAEAAGLEFKVLPNPDLLVEQSSTVGGEGAEDLTRSETFSATILIIVLAATAVICGAFWWLSRRYGTRVRAALGTWRQQRADSEKVYFQRFRQACKSDKPREVMRALLAWLDHTPEFAGTATMGELCRRVDDPEVSTAIIQLNNTIFGKKDASPRKMKWSGPQFLRLIGRARRRLRRKIVTEGHGQARLQPLNPS